MSAVVSHNVQSANTAITEHVPNAIPIVSLVKTLLLALHAQPDSLYRVQYAKTNAMVVTS